MGREGERGGQWGREEERRVEEREREGESTSSVIPWAGNRTCDPSVFLCAGWCSNY